MKVLHRLLRLILLLLVTQVIWGCRSPGSIDLAGDWQYRLDPGETGEQDHWYAQDFGNHKVPLPAALRDHRIGTVPSLDTRWTGGIFDSSWYYLPEMARYRETDPPMFPFWLTPVSRYVGKAWFRKEVVLPREWQGKDLQVFLERPHWQTIVWFDTLKAGSQNSLSTPHVFTIPSEVAGPGKHQITVCVDNAIREVDPGINSHSITDHTQGNWNGITGRMELQVVPDVSVRRVRITPDITAHQAHVEIFLSGVDENEKVRVILAATGIGHPHRTGHVETFERVREGRIRVTLDMGVESRTWSEFSPDLYSLELSVLTGTGQTAAWTETFGMREFTISGKHFEINGIPVYLRGTTECCVFPLTGYPPAEKAAWSAIFKKCKDFGLNHMRFHSYCPPEAAFDAADEAGIYLQVEGPSWAKYSVTLGDGKPIDRYLMDETKRILDTYGNHPSFVMMAYGNEPSGHYVPYLENWVDHFRKYDPRHVYTGASTGRSWAIIGNSDFIVRSPPRGLDWAQRPPGSDFDYRDRTENQQRPYVTFEMGQWCAFPDFDEINQYSGSLKALNFELFRNDLENKCMGDQARDFLMVSGKLQASCYKQEIEAALRTPGLAGFQLLSLNDFPGQGTALVGVLNAFWEEKGYVSAEEFRQFCNIVVPLVRLPKYTFTNLDSLIVPVEIANYSGEILKPADVMWSLSEAGRSPLASGRLAAGDIPLGHGQPLDTIRTSLKSVKAPAKLILEVHAGTYVNSWDIWVYPASPAPAASRQVHVTSSLEGEARQILEEGGKVLLMAGGKVENGKDVVQYYTPVFWNTSWFRMRPPHTTGVLIEADHPMFDTFPTDEYSDLQWWELVNRQQVMNLENFPPDFRPIIQPVDTWFLNRRLAMLFEARVGNGSLVVCSIDLDRKDLEGVVSRQFRYSLLAYMNSSSFHPEEEVTLETISELFEVRDRQGWNSHVRADP